MKIYKYTDGARAKHLRNRAVAVFSNRDKSGEVIIEFAKTDGKETFHIPCAKNIIVKDKIQITGICITEEAAIGLYACLHHYLTKVAEN